MPETRKKGQQSFYITKTGKINITRYQVTSESSIIDVFDKNMLKGRK